MNTTNRKSVFTALAALMIWSAALPLAMAQDTSKGTAVVYPVVFSRNSGTGTSRMTGLNSIREVLQKAGYTLISSTVAAHTWRRLGIPMPMTDRPASLTDLVRFGKAIKARYVVSPVFDFNTRSIWVDLGPKTISTAMVDVQITDVNQGQVVYTRDDITGRSDEKFDMWLVGEVPVVSGGPKTPQEQRAVQIAVSKALKGWVRSGE